MDPFFPGAGAFLACGKRPELWHKLVLGAGGAAGPHRFAGSAPGAGAGAVPQRPVFARPRPGPLAPFHRKRLGPGPHRPGSCRLSGRRGAPGRCNRLDPGDSRRALPGMGQGLRRRSEKPLPQGIAAADFLGRLTLPCHTGWRTGRHKSLFAPEAGHGFPALQYPHCE